GNGLRAAVAIANPHADLVTDPQPLAPPRVVDLDLNRPDSDQLARLPGPGKVILRVSAETAGEDPLQGLALIRARARVEVEDPGPWRPLLVIAVAGRQRDGLSGEVGVAGDAVVDQP